MYVDAFISTFKGTLSWTLKSLLFQVPWYLNYFWGLLLISLLIWGLEIIFPGEKTKRFLEKTSGLMSSICFLISFCFPLPLVVFIVF